MELYYPLSPEKALLLTKKAEYKGMPFKSLNELEASAYNDIMIDMSHEQIYSFPKRTVRNVCSKKYNKAFKTDSQRMAFFIPSLGFVFMVVWLSFVVALLTT